MTIRELMHQFEEGLAEAPNADDFLDLEVKLVDNADNVYPLGDLLTIKNDDNIYFVAHRNRPVTEASPELVEDLKTWDWT